MLLQWSVWEAVPSPKSASLACFLTSKKKKLLKYNTLGCLMTLLPELGALIPQRVTAAPLCPSFASN